MVGLWSFQERDTKLGRFLPPNQHIQRKFICFFTKHLKKFCRICSLFRQEIYLIMYTFLAKLDNWYSHNTHIYGFLSLFFLCFLLLIVVFNMVSIVLKISQHWFHEFFLIVFEDLHWMDFVGESKFNCNFWLNRKTFLEKFHKYQKSSS